MYIQYFLVTFGYHVVPINGINFTENVHTDPPPPIFMMVRFPSLSFSSTWVWTNAFWMLHVVTSQPSCTSITVVKSVPSILMVRLVISSHSIYAHCVLPFAQCQDFIVLSLFSVKSRSDSSVLCLSDLLSKHL